MKEIKSRQLAFTYAGCFIGAGFLSGQELWQFYGSFGRFGALGLVLAVMLQAGLGYICISLAQKKQVKEFEKLIVEKEIMPLRWFFVGLELLIVFFIISIMFAGAGSLFKTVFNVDTFIPSLIFGLLVSVFAFLGLSGVVKVLNGTVPILTVATIIVSIIALRKYGFPNITQAEVTGKTLLMPNFIVAFLLSSIYNVFCLLCIISPLGCLVKDKKTILNSMVIASIVLILIASSVLLPLYANPSFAKYDLPMLQVSKEVSGYLYYVYALLLFLGIFGTAISNMVAIVNYTQEKVKVFKERKYIIIAVLFVMAFVVSRFGFSSLISVLYPISGYVGLIALILIIVNYVKICKKERGKW